MNYEDMSDFEINNLVALAIGAKVTDSYKVGDERETIYYSLGDEEFCVKHGYGSFVCQFDPCNNPADAWPIIEENNISLILDNPTMPCATSNARDLFNDDDTEVGVAYGKPLRAAMIVFLKMQEKA